MKYYLLIIIIVLLACQEDKLDPAIFQYVSGSELGIEFKNELSATNELNILEYLYFYNGSGVAAADFNNDGLMDLYFGSNQGQNKLYLNMGNLKFEDSTQEAFANMKNDGWTNGISVVDINNDGLFDLYLSQVSNFKSLNKGNVLYVNQGIFNGIPKFKEETSVFGLDFHGFGTHSIFADFDLDGDLDCYLLNHSVHDNGTFGKRSSFQSKNHPFSGDRYLENIEGIFRDKTKESGINSTVIGYGLGIDIGDTNQDGWTDIYIGNDFHENDYLYINQKDKSFQEVLTSQIMHTSRFSMGVNIADMNNDAYPEIFSLDMLPFKPDILKASEGEDPFGIFKFKLGYGYNYQYAKNAMQLNNQNNTFSEIANYAGVAASDWSWSVLQEDFDLDGMKDIFISNGIPKRMNDIDYINFISGSDIQWKSKFNVMDSSDLKVLARIPQIKLKNRIFINKGSLQFDDVSETIANHVETFSNGAILVDLDNDNDLDIVTNNIDDAPSIYINNSQAKACRIIIKGTPQNQSGIGVQIRLFTKDTIIYKFKKFNSGFMSSSTEDIIVPQLAYDSLQFYIGDKRKTLIFTEKQNIQSEILLKVDELVNKTPPRIASKEDKQLHIQDVSSNFTTKLVHNENGFIEFDREKLIPHATSAEGPAFLTYDFDGDGLKEIFLGNAKHKPSQFYSTSASFILDQIRNDSIYEDVDICIADFDGDGEQDLVVASGGSEFFNKSQYLQSRLYIQKKGVWKRKSTLLDSLFINAQNVEAIDYNKDGNWDLVVTSRSVPWNYGIAPDSYILKGNGKGEFVNVTEEIVPNFKGLGMVKDTKIIDIDNDDDQDIVVAVEWGNVVLFENDKGRSFKARNISESHGLWNFIYPSDIDQDGDLDLIIGNLGQNTIFNKDSEVDLKMYVNDFDRNGAKEQIVSYMVEGKEIPFATIKELQVQLPKIKKEYLYAKDFAKVDVNKILKSLDTEGMEILTVDNISNVVLENLGNNNFRERELQDDLQFTSYQSATEIDLNGDEYPDYFIGGNFYHNNIQRGRQDADYGSFLINNGNFHFTKQIPSIPIKGVVQQSALINDSTLVLAKNNDQVQFIRF